MPNRYRRNQPFSPLFARVVSIAALLAVHAAVAQVPKPLALPNMPLRNSGTVYEGETLPDGHRIIYGNFKWVFGEPTTSPLQRLLPDGRLDRAWQPPVLGDYIADISADVDGNVYALVENRIVKLSTTDGSIVDAFQATASAIGAIEVRGGFLYATGDWQLPGGGTANLVKLSLESGIADPNYSPSLSSWRRSFAFDPQGRAYVEIETGFRRVLQDGTVDTSWNGPYAGSVRVITASDQALFVAVAGQFGEERIIRKLAATDGAIDEGFNATALGEVYTLYADTGGGVWVGGWVRAVDGVALNANGLARLTPTGNLDTTNTPDCRCSIYDIEAGSVPQSIDLYGAMDTVGVGLRMGLARISEQGFLLPDAGSIESPGTARSMVRQSDGRVLVGGYFAKVGSHATRNVARFLPDGSLDRGFSSNARSAGHALAVSPLDGSIFVGGYGSGGLDKLRPDSGVVVSEWTASGGYIVNDLVALPDGFLYVTGTNNFPPVNGGPPLNLGRVLQAGAGGHDATWAPQPQPGFGRRLITDGQGSLYLAHGTIVSKYDVGSGARVWNTPMGSSTYGLALSGNRLFVSGAFCLPSLQVPPAERRCGVVRLDVANGSLDDTWNFPPAQAEPDRYFQGMEVAAAPSGEVIVAGYYYDIDTEAAEGFLWRADAAGSGVPLPGWRPQATSATAVLADEPNRIWLAGRFEQVSGVDRVGVAAVPIDGPDPIVFVDGYE